MSAELLEMGVKIVVIKLGSNGLYLRTADEAVIKNLGRACPPSLELWCDRELWVPCFKVDVVGTTGSGDTTIAGFLSALLRHNAPEEVITMAVAIGACNVEAVDALSGLRSWEDTLARVEAGWERLDINLALPGWKWDKNKQVWVGPLDGSPTA
jgi:sugar/nucleoside kinase (ribokinase family)